MLLEAGADPTMLDNSACNSLHNCAVSNCVKYVCVCVCVCVCVFVCVGVGGSGWVYCGTLVHIIMSRLHTYVCTYIQCLHCLCVYKKLACDSYI